MTTITQEHLIAELERRQRIQTSMPDYAQSVVDVIPAEHHRMICAALEDLVADRYDDLIVNTPPGSAKSTYVSHVFPSWYLGRFPKRNVIIASHTASLAEKWSRRVRDTVAGQPHHLVFPESDLSKDSTAVTRWTTSLGGECLAAGVGMSILGFRSDLNIIDDPVSGWEQAQSMTQLQKIHDWYKSDLKSRMKPGAKQVLVCQRLSANDLAGFMIASHAENPTRRLRVINLPMVCDAEDDPLGRAIGDILWPEWYSPEMVRDLQQDEFIWKTMYQQKPPAESGSWVSSEDIQFRPTPVITPETTTYGCSDLALSVNSGDYTVHFVVAIDPLGDWDIIDASRERVDPDASATRLVNFCETYSPTEWLIDDDNASKVFMQLVATRARATSTLVPWRPMPMRGQDKETRAAALRGQYKRHKIYMAADAPWARWLTTELLGFPNLIGQGVDDGVDALSCLARRLFSLGRTAEPTPPPKPKPTLQNMTLNDMFEDRERSRSNRRRL